MSILTLLIIIPLIGFFLLLLNKKHQDKSKYIALAFSLSTLLLSIRGYMLFDAGSSLFQLGEEISWLPTLGIKYFVGADGLSFPLVLLSEILTVLVIVFSWQEEKRKSLYFALILLVNAGVVGVFVALDFFLFYIFWEIVLIPMFFMIGIWGGERKRYASIKFLIYTHVASLIMILAIFAMYFEAYNILGYYTFSIPDLTGIGFAKSFQLLVFPALFFAFAVKLPLVPFHTWLPDAHVEAPTGGSVLLAGLLLKMGGYGMIRVAYLMMPEGAKHFTTIVVFIGILSIVYGAFVALGQDDLKKMIAYSSVSHMGFVILGIASLNYFGFKGAIFQMVAHGLISAILFMACGAIQAKAGTRSIKELSGLYQVMPVCMSLLILSFFASMGIPGFAGFIGEFTVLLGFFQSFSFWIFAVVVGMIITVVYYLRAFQKIAFGDLKEKFQEVIDLKTYEALPMTILLALTIFFGLKPCLLLNLMDGKVQSIVDIFL